MKAWRKVLVHRACVGFAAGLLGLVLPAAAQQAAVSHQQIAELPDSPGAMVSKASEPFQLETERAQSQTVAAAAAHPAESGAGQNQSPETQPPATQPPSPTQKPVGTAVAAAPGTGGIAASQPAGVAIAPVKQRRVKTIILRTGAIIGAGVAVGTVIALTEATPSKPPGAH